MTPVDFVSQNSRTECTDLLYQVNTKIKPCNIYKKAPVIGSIAVQNRLKVFANKNTYFIYAFKYLFQNIIKKR